MPSRACSPLDARRGPLLGAKAASWHEGPDHSVVSLCFVRAYVARVSDILERAPQETRQCIGAISEHLTRVAAAYEQSAILELHRQSVEWERYKRRVVCDHVAQLGPRKWSKIASYLPGRIGKQCRER